MTWRGTNDPMVHHGPPDLYGDRAVIFKGSLVFVAQEDSKRMPHLANYSDDPHMCGRLMFHPLQVGREYSLGFNQKVSGLNIGQDFGLLWALGLLPVDWAFLSNFDSCPWLTLESLGSQCFLINY